MQDTAPSLDDRRPCFLGVEQSLLNKRWEERPGDERVARALAQRLGVPDLVARVLAHREVALDGAEHFLSPTLRESLPNPSTLMDMDRAAERLAAAIMAEEPIAVFGDYDVDGATSSALIKRYLTALGRQARIYIPDRIAEGYGPNAEAMTRLAGEGARLLITVDCGISAHAALEAAREAGLEVLVVDHHKAEAALPPAQAIVNPNRIDDTSGLGQLAAVGVTFLLLIAVNRHLRAAGWFADGRGEPDLRQWLDMVALGTVCDVVPLTGLNRAIVVQGLKVMAQRRNPGLRALADVAGLDERPGCYHLGFVLGPRVNAGGRVGEAGLGTELLSTDDPARAEQIAQRLDGFNRERQAIEKTVLAAAVEQVEAAGRPEDLVFVAGAGWHPGVIGIVASRLKERYNLPAVVIALEEGVGKGSGRSVPGVDLGSAVIAARQADLLVNGGGHAMAAGLTVEEGALAELRAFLARRLRQQMDAIQYQPALGFDAVLQPGAASVELIELLEQVGPYGTGNPEPRFALSGVHMIDASVVGENHVRCRIGGVDGKSLKGIAFRAMDGPLGPALLSGGGRSLHLAGKLRADTWMGRNGVQFIIEDAAFAS